LWGLKAAHGGSHLRILNSEGTVVELAAQIRGSAAPVFIIVILTQKHWDDVLRNHVLIEIILSKLFYQIIQEIFSVLVL